jgi:rod shape-determining protein MreD
MRWIRFAVLILIVTILQTSLIEVVAVTTADIKPDLLLILLVFFAIHNNPTDAIITSFTIGFAADLIGPTMGPRIISFGLFGTILSDMRRAIAIRKIPYQAIAIFVTGFFTSSVSFFFVFLKAETTTSNIYNELFWKPLYSAVVGPFLFLPIAWLMRIRINRFSRY